MYANKVAVGDQDGVILLFSIRKDVPTIHFKTLPVEKIRCIQLGGAAGNFCFILNFKFPNSWLFILVGTVPDKIFAASETKVRAFNKKGKLFLTFESSLTEPIKSMFVIGNHLLLCGNHVYNHYRDCKDIGSYLCGDMIVDVAAICPRNVSQSNVSQKSFLNRILFFFFHSDM